MQKTGEFVVALSAGTITYSWVADATEISTFVASLIGIATAAAGAWFYFENAIKMRKERKDGEKDTGE